MVQIELLQLCILDFTMFELLTHKNNYYNYITISMIPHNTAGLIT